MPNAKKEIIEYIVHGQITYSESNQPARGMRVTVMDADFIFDDKLGEMTTNEEGKFTISYTTEKFRDFIERAPDIYLLIRNKQGCLLTTTRNSVIRGAGRNQEINVQLAGSGPEPQLPTVTAGGIPVDRRTFEQLEPEVVLEIAAFAFQGQGDPQVSKMLDALSPELSLDRLRADLCFTPLVIFLEDTLRIKNWSRDIRLHLEEILTGYDPHSRYATYSCGNFDISYNTTGIDQPPSADPGGDITMPGTGTVVGTTTGGNGVPDYIERLCFWLQNALDTYTNPPFSLRSPAGSGNIPVNVTGTGAGSASPSTMSLIIGRSLNNDLLAAVSTHELMHLIQFQYNSAGTAGNWHPGILEGGAVLGEDVVFDSQNRYIVQATASGTLESPSTRLDSSGARYFLALFLKYISEQQSSRINPVDEPTIGVETYRELLEQFDVDGYTSSAFETAVRKLPWYQTFYNFGYLDSARLDETSSETLLGNFWLACYLKEFGTNVPDRRFDFMEDEENATWDTLFGSSDTVSTLGQVELSSNSTLNNEGSIILSSGSGGYVSPFAARFYKVNIDSAVDTLRVNFSADAGFTKPLLQVVLVESGNVVRDILRSDQTDWSRTIANTRNGTSLDHALIVVAGTDTGGSFSLSLQEVAPAPDVTITRWHHVTGTHYEIDSFGWAWTWVSPDIWVDNDDNGLADNEVFFEQNNKLYVRLHNQGHANAAGISVELWYQDASGGLSDSAWLPVQNAAGVNQILTGLELAAGDTSQWPVDWAPEPSGTSNHFCVRAIVTVPGDPNTDNKRCLSNFGNVITASPYVDLPLTRHMPEVFKEFQLNVIPRTHGEWAVSAVDRFHARTIDIKPNQRLVDNFRVRRKHQVSKQSGQPTIEPDHLAKMRCPCNEKVTRRELKPDPFGHYPTDPRALPPGLEDVPLITISHVVDGEVIGGFTWAIREKKK